MSFTLNVKQEIVNNKKNRKDFESFLFGMLLTSSFIEGNIIFTTAVKEVGEYFLYLLKYQFKDIDYTIEENISNITTQYNYIIKDHNYTISNFYDLTNVHTSYKDKILDNEKLLSQCISGYFLVRGSVNDPNNSSSYHLEFLCSNMNNAIFIQKLINTYEFNAKIAKRREKLIVYIKEAEKIVDLIRIIGASKCAFSYEEVRIEKDFNNSINRVINCEIANEQKVQKAAYEQLKYIEYLEYNYPLEKLDSKILLVMKVRKDNVDASLVELVDIIKDKYDITLSKPGLSHRFAKIKEIAISHQEGRKK